MRWAQIEKRRETLFFTAAGLVVLLMAGAAGAGPYGSAVLADQPFAYYRFEDPSSNDGDRATDETGRYHGTYVGQPVLVGDSPGIIGGTSLEIGLGTPESYVTAPLGPLGSVLGDGVTFEFWVKTTDTRVQKRIFWDIQHGFEYLGHNCEQCWANIPANRRQYADLHAKTGRWRLWRCFRPVYGRHL